MRVSSTPTLVLKRARASDLELLSVPLGKVISPVLTNASQWELVTKTCFAHAVNVFLEPCMTEREPSISYFSNESNHNVFFAITKPSSVHIGLLTSFATSY